MERKVTMHAFSVGTLAPITREIKPFTELTKILTGSTSIQQRFMTLSQADAHSEGDFISFIQARKTYAFGLFIRMKEGDVTHIMKDQLSSNKLTLDDIAQTNEENIAGTVKDYAYFLLSNSHLIYFASGLSVKAFQVHINWLISAGDETKIGYSFNPVIKKVKNLKIEEIKKVKISDSFLAGKPEFSTLTKKLDLLKDGILKHLLSDSKDLKDIESESIVSAQILLIFKKARKKKKEEIKKQLTAVLKSTDHNDIEVTGKGGRKFKGNEFVMKRSKDIEFTSNEYPSEPHLEEEMKVFLNDARNDKDSD